MPPSLQPGGYTGGKPFEMAAEKFVPNPSEMYGKTLVNNGILGGGFNPFEKYAGQIGSFRQVEVEIKNMRNHHLG